MISEQIKQLKSLQEAMRLDNKLGRVKCDSSFVENRIKIIDDAICTIETLSAKIQANNFNNGWIKCEDRLPQDFENVLVWFEYYRYGEYNRLFQTVGISYTYDDKWSGFVNGSSGWSQLRIIAWQPLIEPYKESD